jgi:hypothetical protein
MIVIQHIQEFADYDIYNDTMRYRMDLKIDGVLVVLSHVFGRDNDTRGFDEVRNTYIAFMEHRSSTAQCVEKPHTKPSLPLCNIEKMRERYPS